MSKVKMVWLVCLVIREVSDLNLSLQTGCHDLCFASSVQVNDRHYPQLGNEHFTVLSNSLFAYHSTVQSYTQSELPAEL